MSARALFAAALVLLVLLALRFAWNLGRAVRGRLPWGRLLLPGLLLLEGGAALAKVGPGALAVKGATLVLLEAAVLVLAWKVWRSGDGDSGGLPERRLARRLGSLLPPRAARLVALELVVLGSAFRALAFRPPASGPGTFSTHRESALGSLLLALPVLAVGDLLLLDLALRKAPVWVRWAVHATDLYALLWLLGLWQSLRDRPHRLGPEGLRLHRGLLRSLEVPAGALVAVREPDPDGPPATDLTVNGGTEVLLELARPLAPEGVWGTGRPRDRVRVTADDPEAFRRALLAWAAPPAR